MAIGDLFRPKHKHSDPSVRADAVRSMSADDLEVLLEVARDDRDPGVRRQAIEKIGDAAALEQLAAAQEDARLSELARARAVELLVAEAVSAEGDEREALARVAQIRDAKGLAEVAAGARLKVVRSAALDRLDDDRALAQVVRAAGATDEWGAALERIGDIEVLRSIAMDETRKDVGHAAVDRIHDPDLLEGVAARAKNKSVRGRAKKRRAQIEQAEEVAMGAPSEEKRAHAERVQIVRLIEKRAMGGEWVESHREVSGAVARWDALGVEDDAELVSRYETARRRYFDNRARYAPAAPPQPSAAAPEPEPQPQPEPEPQPSAEPPITTVSSSPLPEGAVPEASAAPDSAPPAAGPEVTPEAREKNRQALDELTARVEALATRDELKGFEKSLKKADRQRGGIGPLPSGSEPLITRYQEAHARAVIRLGELRETEDWKRWANMPVLEKLIADADALLARADEEDRLGPKLRELQNRWKQAGPAPREKSQELWDRFKASCDQIYERVKAQRSAMSEVQKENLRRKEELCARAEELSESTDWDATAEALKKLQKQWKQIGPVPRRKANAVWKRFRAACDLFFERRRPHLEQRISQRSENVAAKEQLVAEAEALAADTELAAEEAIHRVRQVQRRWRDVGPVPHRDFAPLQERYKAACDAVYRKRDEERERARAEAEAAIEAVASQVRAAGELAQQAGVDPGEVAREVLAARAALLELGADPRRTGAIRDDLERVTREAVEAHPEAFRGTELDPESSRKRKEKLCARVEDLAPEAADPGEMTPEAIAERLRAALADRALGGVLSKTGGRPAAEVVAEARQAWARIGPVPGEEGAALQRRFDEACERALGAAVSG